ncbi:hypothetical protein QFC22_005805 [Naganishia vaughanmartiniae]|uniref:Uncharacterized protein n=1 Tax=Naganishia vaughanmartiniae TaxID=1424756 RepID=A0ACC2WTY0_9TREE|nr:hypothetical protein QFC22_005805 [Naganishia vaughanmartiniae]
MNINFNYPDLIPDPTYSFTTTTTHLPAIPLYRSPTATANGTHHQQEEESQQHAARDAMYAERLGRALSGGEEELAEQEERVYRAESPTPSDGRPPDHRQEDNRLPTSEGGDGDQTGLTNLDRGASPADSSSADDAEEAGAGERDLDEEMEDMDRDREDSFASEAGSG